jgi:copper homeostasis protein
MTLVEAAVETLRSAVAAERGGARRVELCASLDEGGTTPELELVAAVCARLRIPVLAIVRPRPGGFVYSATEMRAMLDVITRARTLGIAGIVAGVLRADGTVDVERMRQIVDAASGLPVTFHRAFDVTASLPDALEDVVASGASRLLTSGGAATALEGAEVLAALVDQAGERITIVAGGGIRENNVRELIVRSRVSEIHTRLSAGEDLDEARMRGLIELVRAIP